MKAFCLFLLVVTAGAENRVVEADLLIVGGTESGCAAAVQAARMGIERIVLVNDTKWLGGQFTSEGLAAIDENRARGYDGTLPIPRSGAFAEIVGRIEARNARAFNGVTRPGNTRVITTSQPWMMAEEFAAWVKPYQKSGPLTIHTPYRLKAVRMDADRLTGVAFDSLIGKGRLEVNATLTIDASDWGDVIQMSGAFYDVGIDRFEEYGEPRAPRDFPPKTDMNPITWCVILEETEEEQLIPEPPGYDARNFLGAWGWIKEAFAYSTRRLVDREGFPEIEHRDVVLINNPNIDYALDRHVARVAEALEADEPGASKKNIVRMTPPQREIVFADAKNRSLQYIHYLQQSFPKFRKMKLSRQFGTDDDLPPKPYIREGLRLVAKCMVTQEDVEGFGGRQHFANRMFPDAAFSWQFEMDFHPTQRKFLDDKEGATGPWESAFRGERRFHRGGTGRAVFPVRGFIPVQVTGLLGAQKNLGYTSIVGSSCRLHDQSMAAGQACGAVAALSLLKTVEPVDIAYDRALLVKLWVALLDQSEGRLPAYVWPFADMEPTMKELPAVQMLALLRLLPMRASDTSFRAEQKSTEAWANAILENARSMGFKVPDTTLRSGETRGAFALKLWNELQDQPVPPFLRKADKDADGDGFSDSVDPLPFTEGLVSWTQEKPKPLALPESVPAGAVAINFTTKAGPGFSGFERDSGETFSEARGYGWSRDKSKDNRLRNEPVHPLRDGLVFTRKQDTWEAAVPNGRYEVRLSIGDSSFEQPGQHVKLEGYVLAADARTEIGGFRECKAEVEVTDGRLTLVIGSPAGGSNTTVNWLLAVPLK